MNRNSTTIWIPSLNAITPVPWVNNAPDFSGITEPTLSVLQAAYQANINNIVIIPDPIPVPPVIVPDPIGFREKMIGANGDNTLFQTYQAILSAALNPNVDTSSLNAALIVFNAALVDNDWSKEYAKPAYSAAYDILKSFLSAPQIAIIDAANIEFNLV